MQDKQPRLKNTTIGLMVAVALFYDILSGVLAVIFMGWLVVPLFYLHFWFWFRLHGVSFFSMKRAPTHLIGFAAEALTAGIAPAMTAIVARVAVMTKLQDSKIGGVINMADRVDKLGQSDKNTSKAVEKDKAA